MSILAKDRNSGKKKKETLEAGGDEPRRPDRGDDHARVMARVVGTHGYVPHVNLLPASIVAKRRLRRLKTWLLVVLVLVVVAVAGLYTVASMDASSAKDDLHRAQAENTRLMAEQATYSEVPHVLKQIQLVDDAREAGMGTEVGWARYIQAVRKALPSDAVLESMTATVASPVADAPEPGDPLQIQGIGSIQLKHRSPTVPDAATWLESLSSIKGFATPLYSTAVANDEDGTKYYEVTTTVQLTDKALSGRFVPDEDADTDDDKATGDTADQASSGETGASAEGSTK